MEQNSTNITILYDMTSKAISDAIVDDFMKRTKMVETPNGTLRQEMSFLCTPKSINRMITMSEMGRPALLGVVKELEEKFADSDLPLNFNAPDNNAPNRRNIGWMVKFIMGKFGYEPIERTADNDTVTRSAIPNTVSTYFSSAAIYKKTGKGTYTLRPTLAYAAGVNA